MAKIGLLGGSFNPAHRGHRHLSRFALTSLELDEVWWLVSPGNPLKAGAADMAPLAVRLRSARAMARRLPVRATAIERRLGTRYTVDTMTALQRQRPGDRFIWLMGGDIVGEFERWHHWRRLARTVAIAVIDRPGYAGLAGAGVAAAWLRRFVHRSDQARHWTTWSLPAVVPLHLPPDDTAATAIRAHRRGWADALPAAPTYDPLSRRHIG